MEPNIEILITILLVLVLTTFELFLVKQKKSKSRNYLISLILIFISWMIIEIVAAITPNNTIALILWRIAHAFIYYYGLIFVVFILEFSERKLNKKIFVPILSIYIIFSLFTLFSDKIILLVADGNYIMGEYYFIYSLFFALSLIAALIFSYVFFLLHKDTMLRKKQLAIFIIAMFLVVALGVTFQGILPSLGYDLVIPRNIGMVLMISLIIFNMFRFDFLDFDKKKFTINQKIMTVFFITGLIMAVTVGLGSYLGSKFWIQEDMEMDLNKKIVSNIDNIATFTDLIIKQINFLEESIGHSSMNKTELNEHIVELIKNDESFLNIHIANINGIIEFSSDESLIGKNIRSEKYFIEGKKNNFKIISISKSDPKIIISNPLESYNGGVLIAELDFLVLNRLFGYGGKSEVSEEYFFVDSNYLAYSLKENMKIILNDSAATDCISQKNPKIQYMKEYKNMGGEIVYGAHYWLKDENLCFIAEIKKDIVFAKMSDARDNSIYGVLVLWAIFLIIGFILSRKLSKPLSDLRKNVDEISNGNLDIPVEINSKDEIGELAKSFDQMRIEIKQSKEELQNRVSEKTNELARRVEELEKIRELTDDTEIYAENMRKQKWEALQKILELEKEIKKLKKKR